MPAKHRWMTLRDDLVFAVFLYQRWLYRTDYSRADEFGYVYTKSAAKPKKLPKLRISGVQREVDDVSNSKAAANSAAGGSGGGSRVRKHGRETRCLWQAGRPLQAGRGAGVEHLLSGCG